MASSASYRGMCGTHMGTWNGGTAGANYALRITHYALKKGGNIRPLRYYELRIFPAETQERMNIAADTITMIIGARLTAASSISAA